MKTKSQDKNSRSETFRARLAGLLTERGVSQRELSTAISVSPGTISNYLSGGRALPRAEELLALAKFFEVSVEWLLGEPDLGERKNKDRVGISPKPTPDRTKLRAAVRRIKLQIGTIEELLGDK